MMSNVTISTVSALLDLSVIERKNESYWAAGRERAVIERSIAHSLCFGVYAAGRQIAFARVITDRAVFAYLADVFVVPQYRGRGVGKALMRAILQHQDLQGLGVFLLADARRTRPVRAVRRRGGSTGPRSSWCDRSTHHLNSRR